MHSICIPGSACQTPPHPPPPHPTAGISVIFQIEQAPPGQDIYVKNNNVALDYYTKDNCFCDKERKIFAHMQIQFLIISILPSKCLSQLIINVQSMRNSQPMPYPTQMRTSYIQTRHRVDFNFFHSCYKKAYNTTTLR